MRNKILFTLTALLLMATGMRAQTPYAVYDSSDKTLTFKYDNERPTSTESVYDLHKEIVGPGWLKHSSDITTVVFDESFKDARPTTCDYWFNEFNDLTTIVGLENLNTSKVTDMSHMFSGCSNLESLKLSNFNTSNVTDMSYMFHYCSGLTGLDLSSFDTSNVTDMSKMFFNCLTLARIYVSDKFKIDNVTSSDNMFGGCRFTNSDVDKTNAHYNDGGYFTYFGPYAVYDPYENTLTFKYEPLESGKTENDFYLNKGTNEPGWLEHKSNITKVVFEKSFKDARPTTCYKWFYGFEKLTTIEGLGYLNTSNVTNMSYMFHGCESLIVLKLHSFNTEKVEKMYAMFAMCTRLIELDLSSFNTANVTNMSYMFSNCHSLFSLDLSNFNTSNKTNMDYMFYKCSGLEKLDMSNVTGIKELAAHADLQKRSIIIIVPEGTDIANDVSEENYIVMGDKTLFVRTFAANNPHTLYLPFAVSTTDINGCFYEYDSCDGNSVKFTKVKNEKTNANKAYLFKSETDEKIVFTGEGAIEDLPTFEEEDGASGLYGRYTTKTFTAAEANEGIYYGWAGGKFKRAGADAKVKPNRAYLKLSSDASNAPARLSVKFEDENTTGIINIEREDIGTESPIYNLNGQRVGNSYRGLVIKNGKKIFNKKTR